MKGHASNVILPRYLWQKYQRGKEERQYRRRIADLVARGLTVGRNVVIEPTASIDPIYPYLISIGDNCVIGPNVKLFAHDATPIVWIDDYIRVGKVVIKENCFIASNSLIMPGVTVGPNVLVGAGSIVTRDIPPNSCVAGIPARFYANADEMIEGHRKLIEQGRCRGREYFTWNLQDQLEQKDEIREAVNDGDIYVKRAHPYPWIVNRID
jgi:acetyltransferase-like isoleucine patch superfamily enzyme